MKLKKILTINPGSTSTKLAVYDDEEVIISETLDHPVDEIREFEHIQDQLDFRKNVILDFLKSNNISLDSLNAIVGRGGLLPPVKSGAYKVNDIMIDRLKNRPIAEHASNLGGIIAYEIAEKLGIDAFIYDSVAVDELRDIARISGTPLIERASISHALNSRAMAHKYADMIGKKYKELNLIVAHLGGGITVSVHEKGSMTDVLSDIEGSFSPERSGSVPCDKLIDLCYSGKYDIKTMKKILRGNAGLIAYLGTIDAREVEKMIGEGNSEAALVYEAMAYQVAKSIGELSTVLKGQVDAIILTGGIAYSDMMTNWIKDRVSFLATVEVLAGENELEALAHGILRVLRGEEKVNTYIE